MLKKTKLPLWRVKALEFSQTHFKHSPHGMGRVRVEKAFIEGLRAYKRQLEAEANRILASLDGPEVVSIFERGQADGVRWLLESVNGSWELDK